MRSEGTVREPYMIQYFRWAWSQWWIVAILWYICAVAVVVGVKKDPHKAMLSVYGNLIFGTPLVMPFALSQGMTTIRHHWRAMLLIAILAGLERNLTNDSMYSIGGSLKTALHGFNVLLTFVAGSILGVDKESRECLLNCHCKGNMLLFVAILLVSAGGLVTALCGPSDWQGGALGITLQLGSGVCYALKYSAAKLLLGDHEHGSSGSSAENKKPSKMQIALFANPIAGLIALCFLPFFENSLAPPYLQNIVVIALGATGILIFEFHLVELTSPLTVSVLAVFHNIVIVFYFVIFVGETLNVPQMAGFIVSSVGAVLYAVLKRRKPTIQTSSRNLSLVIN